MHLGATLSIGKLRNRLKSHMLEKFHSGCLGLFDRTLFFKKNNSLIYSN